MPEEDKKTFREIEGGMIYLDENGDVLYVGLPKKVKESTSGKAGIWAKIFQGGGAEVGGQKDREIDYHWVRVGDGFPTEGEGRRDLDSVTTMSGTIAISSSTAVTPPPPPFDKQCPKCGAWYRSGVHYCYQCGHEL